MASPGPGKHCRTHLSNWIDGETSWQTATAFRQLATHTAESVEKGDRILVVGKFRPKETVGGSSPSRGTDKSAIAVNWEFEFNPELGQKHENQGHVLWSGVTYEL